MEEIHALRMFLEPDGSNCWDKLPTLSTALWICSTLSRPSRSVGSGRGNPGNVVQNAYSLKAGDVVVQVVQIFPDHPLNELTFHVTQCNHTVGVPEILPAPVDFWESPMFAGGLKNVSAGGGCLPSIVSITRKVVASLKAFPVWGPCLSLLSSSNLSCSLQSLLMTNALQGLQCPVFQHTAVRL